MYKLQKVITSANRLQLTVLKKDYMTLAENNGSTTQLCANKTYIMLH